MAPDPADIQGLVRRLYRYQISRHLLFRIDDAGAAKRMLGALLPRVTTAAADVGKDAEPLLNVGLTWAGLVEIGAVTEADAPNFSSPFANPEDYATKIDWGDWGGRLAGSDVHIAVQIHCRTDDAMARASADVRQMAEGGLTELKPWDGPDGAVTGRALRGGLMHFDLRDGISEPDVDWDDTGADPRKIDMRHFLLGYANASFATYPKEGDCVKLARNGSYGVMQVVRQHSAAWESYLDAAAPKLSPDLPLDQARKKLRAKMLGRWDDGTPLALSPDKDGADVSLTEFGYADDPVGLRCPLQAHIRLANRRDQPLDPLSAASFPNGGPYLLRRGLPYGPKFEGGHVDDGVDRGVVGLFLCADILNQYMTVQKWMDALDFSPDFEVTGLTNLQDMIAPNRNKSGADLHAFIPFAKDGDRANTAPSNIGAPRLPLLPSFTTVVGTVLLLMPGMDGLRAIIAGRP